MDDPTLSLNETGIIGSLTLPTENLLSIHITHLIQQASGLHAHLSICVDDIELARTVMNVDRLEDRIKLANAAYKDFHPAIKKVYSADFLKIHIAYVCGHAWETWVEAMMPKAEPGRPDFRVEYMVEPFVVRGGGTILFGPPKAGKSYVGMAMTISVDANCNKLWDVCLEHAMWINLERSRESVLWRLAKLNLALGLDTQRELLILHARGKRFKDVYDLARAAIKKHHIGFVGMDSLTRMGAGSLIKDESINEAIDMLNNLDVTWLALGHNPTATEAHVYGGNLWDAGADATVQLTSVRKDQLTGIRMETFLTNDTPLSKPKFYALEFAPGLEGLKVLRRAKASEFPELSLRRDDVGQVIAYLREFSKANATQLSKDLKLNRSRVALILSSRTELFQRVSGRTALGQDYSLISQDIE